MDDKYPKNPIAFKPIKVSRIISTFKEPNPDPKLIAKKFGFQDHKDMARYMKNKGYEWNTKENNYVKTIDIVEKIDKSINENLCNNTEENLTESINEYIPFIRFLYEKREEIYQLLSGVQENSKIPRYALPGIVRTKSIYMNDTIARLTAEFSKEKNVTQREIVEAALVEYLQKYGYKSEIESILRSR